VEPASDPKEIRNTWGIQSLPWLVLLDKDHVVREEGFAPSSINAVLRAMAETP